MVDVEQGFRQSSMFVNMFSLRCCASPRNGSSLMQPSCTTVCNSNGRKRKARGGARHGLEKSSDRGNEEGVQTLWGMMHADDSGIISRSPGILDKMIKVVVAACAEIKLKVSEAKTGVMCL